MLQNAKRDLLHNYTQGGQWKRLGMCGKLLRLVMMSWGFILLCLVLLRMFASLHNLELWKTKPISTISFFLHESSLSLVFRQILTMNQYTWISNRACWAAGSPSAEPPGSPAVLAWGAWGGGLTLQAKRPRPLLCALLLAASPIVPGLSVVCFGVYLSKGLEYSSTFASLLWETEILCQKLAEDYVQRFSHNFKQPGSCCLWATSWPSAFFVLLGHGFAFGPDPLLSCLSSCAHSQLYLYTFSCPFLLFTQWDHYRSVNEGYYILI